MTLLLATEMDWTMILWVLGALATLATTLVTTVGGGMWVGGRVLLTWLDKYLRPICVGHKEMLDTIKTEMPKVSQTLCALKETQVQQCETLELHTKKLELHTDTLQTILKEVAANSSEKGK